MTERQKKEIVAVLGKQYTTPIIRHLARRKIYNTRNEPYSAQRIREFVNGVAKNDEVELEIAKFVRKEKTRRKNLVKAKNKLLK